MKGENSMAITYLYLLRHGKTWFNEKEIVQGWCDSLLIPQAQKEARTLQKNIRQYGIDVIYCSPTLRTRQTAYCVCPWLTPIEDARLMEIHYGYLEGESAKTLQLFYPNRYDFEHFQGYAGGESWKEAGTRFMQAVQDIVQKEAGKHILLVSHGAVLTYFLHQLDPSIREKIPNLCLVKVSYDGQFHLVSGFSMT